MRKSKLTVKLNHFQYLHFPHSDSNVSRSLSTLRLSIEIPTKLKKMLQTFALSPGIMKVVGEVVIAAYGQATGASNGVTSCCYPIWEMRGSTSKHSCMTRSLATGIPPVN